jgi:hypothetical protein
MTVFLWDLEGEQAASSGYHPSIFPDKIELAAGHLAMEGKRTTNQ